MASASPKLPTETITPNSSATDYKAPSGAQATDPSETKMDSSSPTQQDADSSPPPEEAAGSSSAAAAPESLTMNGKKYGPDEQITIFHDPDNFTVKHPLANTWTLWFTKPPKGGEHWSELLKEVVSFNSVEDFWGVYSNVMPASTLAMKSDFHLFKKGVKPEWEDKANREGGKWSYSFRGKPQINIDDLWLHTCLAAIGETLEPVPAAGGGSGSGKAAQKQESEIMGVVVNVRKGFYRVGLWTKSKDKKMEEQLVAIGRRFKEVLRLPATETVEFQAHDDSEKSGTSRAKNRYYA